MIIKYIQISNLRNIQRAEIRPSSGLNLFHGPNGAGKTTVLESLVVLAKGRSFRSGATGSLIGPDEPFFRILAETVEPGGVSCRLGLERTHTEWRARIQGSEVSQLSDLAAHLPIVLMEPNSHLLVSGGPEIRRRFCDWGVFHVKHAFLEDWRRFHRALRQRNAALRSGDAAMVRSLDPPVVSLSEIIDAHRRSHLEPLATEVRELLAELSPELPEVELRYHPGWRGESV
ncbi:MAG: DNA replication and repair protein RecF, partial [Gammaproteobacteria bacterium]